MAAKDTRPVNLDLTKFSFPITAIASIMHRICAVISWVGLGLPYTWRRGFKARPRAQHGSHS